MSEGARVSWDVCRSWRATDQKASDSVSSPSESRRPVVSRSWVTGIAYQRLLLYPHVEVTSAIGLSGQRVRARALPRQNRAASWNHHTLIETSAALAGLAAPERSRPRRRRRHARCPCAASGGCSPL